MNTWCQGIIYGVATQELKKVRDGHRTQAKKVMNKSLTDTPIPSLQELKVNLASLLKKQETLEKYDVDILQLLTEEDEVEKEVDETCIYAEDVRPNSSWIKGDPWMQGQEYDFPVKSVDGVILPQKEKHDANKDLVYDVICVN